MAVRRLALQCSALVRRSVEAGREASVVKVQSRSQQVLERGRSWVMFIIACYVICFAIISARVAMVSVPENGGVVALFERAGHVVSRSGASKNIDLMTLVTGDGLQEMLSANAQSEEEKWKNSLVLPRADIVDRNGVVLATSLEAASLFATMKEIREPEQVADLVTQVLPDVSKALLIKQMKSGRKFVWVKRNLTPQQQYEVNRLGIPGLYFQKEYVRVYPQGNLLSHILGFVGTDNNGLAGVEKFFDKKLRDTSSHEPLKLAVDVRMQYMMYDQLYKAVEDFQAIGATGIIMDIKSGEVTSMVNLPDFDPNHPAPDKSLKRFNRASLGTYEMGSTFKAFTTALALDVGTVDMHGGYDATNPIRVANFVIKDSHPKRRWLSVPEIFAYSSNIGTVRMIMDVGMQKQQEFLKKLGLFEPVQIELPERARPQIPHPWKEISMMTVSYGHGIAVTPLHLVQALATILGDGHFRPITLVKDGNKGKVEGVEPIVKMSTVQNIRRLMRMVVQYGTGKKADAEGYRVGGKTGTAEKPGANGRYNEKAMISSFIGAFPMDNPQYIVFVTLDEPKGNKSTYNFATGGWVAAPVVEKIVSQMGPMLGMTPIFEMPEDEMDNFWQHQQDASVGGEGRVRTVRY
jgi:cell division protein FtsI (penicillin-binding protein 3)